MTSVKKPIISARNLTIGYDGTPVMQNLTFDINRGDVFAIMGGSGSGKSTLMRALTGLVPPMAGRIMMAGHDMTAADAAQYAEIMQHVGVLFQSGALFGSMTVGENVALPLHQYTNLGDDVIHDIVAMKLDLVGLNSCMDFYPSELSGGMKKRAGLARALALDPEIVFFDEPSAGLDPISSRALDELILQINRAFGTTIVIVSHELESIFTVANDSIFIDRATRGIIARGNPRELRRNPPNDTLRNFLTRGKETK